MSVHVDELTSEVITEPETPAARGPEPRTDPRWADEEQFRVLREQFARDRQRTSADGFDD